MLSNGERSDDLYDVEVFEEADHVLHKSSRHKHTPNCLATSSTETV